MRSRGRNTQEDMRAIRIDGFQYRRKFVEIRRPTVVGFEGLPVPRPPLACRQFNVTNTPADAASHRDTEPLHPLGRLDPVTVAPVVLRELHVVVEDELINRGNDVEIAFPRDVIRLDYR